jgi:hypothetical protein
MKRSTGAVADRPGRLRLAALVLAAGLRLGSPMAPADARAGSVFAVPGGGSGSGAL